jgi:AraC-like DNA-binding protein
MRELLHFKTINQFNRFIGYPESINPDVSVFFYDEIEINIQENRKILRDYYSVGFIGDAEGYSKYGDGLLNFGDRQIVFLGNNQVSQGLDTEDYFIPNNGWNLDFSPKLISGTHIHSFIRNFPFFHYKSRLALNLNENEIDLLTDIVKRIKELSLVRVTKWSNALIINNIELLLKYCMYFYENSKSSNVNSTVDRNSYVDQFEFLLNKYYKENMQDIHGLPSVKYFGDEIGITPYYLSTLVKQVTFMSARTHINEKIMDEAKHNILTGELNINQISKNLGFKNSQHFSKFFKNNQGISPREYIKIFKY